MFYWLLHWYRSPWAHKIKEIYYNKYNIELTKMNATKLRNLKGWPEANSHWRRQWKRGLILSLIQELRRLSFLKWFLCRGSIPQCLKRWVFMVKVNFWGTSWKLVQLTLLLVTLVSCAWTIIRCSKLKCHFYSGNKLAAGMSSMINNNSKHIVYGDYLQIRRSIPW